MMVMPGDEIAVEEEYVASDGTFVKDGKIYASWFGRLVLDDEECTARVECPNPPNTLKVGDVIYASIDDVRKTMAPATALCKEDSERNIASSTMATIHVSKISSEYTSDVANEFKKGDLIRARVISIAPSLQLTTKNEHLGVIRALCGDCKTEMVRKGRGLFCPKCKKNQSRKLADDYGDVQI